MKKTILFILAVIFCSNFAQAQMLIAPTSVYLDENNSITSIVIQNRTTEVRELSLDLRFGYPMTDSSGNTHIIYNDTINEKKYSLVQWLKVFPKKIVLKPNEKQTIRIFAKIPSDLTEGMYWARMAVVSRPQSVSNFDTTSGQIGAQINLTFNQVIPVLLKKGTPSVNIKLDGTEIISQNSTTSLSVDLSTENLTPFIGHGKLTIKDNNNSIVQQLSIPFNVYFQLRKLINLDLEKMPPGNYTYDLEIVSGREEITENYVMNSQKIVQSKSFYYQGRNSVSKTK